MCVWFMSSNLYQILHLAKSFEKYYVIFARPERIR